jgi:hypothetical protein
MSKLLSSRAFPVTCGGCKGLSYAPGSAGGIVMVVNALVLTGAGFCAVYWQSWMPLVPGVAVAFALWLLRLHFEPLFSLSEQQVSQARVKGSSLLLAILFSPLQ